MVNIMRKLNDTLRKNRLTKMNLPDDVLLLIKEYSMPVTRPDWRTIRVMSYYIFKYECYVQNNKRWQKIRYNPNITYKEVFTRWWYNYMYTPRYEIHPYRY